MSTNTLSSRPTEKQAIFFCCDIQETFRGVMPKMEHMIPASRFMLQASKVLDIPVVVTEQKPFKPTLEELQETYKEDIGGRVHLSVKTKFSMLTEEVLAFLATHNERRIAYLFGVEAHVCVLQTALDLIRHGYTVLVVEDAVRSQRPNDCEQALLRMRDFGCIVTTTESCLYEMMGDAKHPSFKPLLPFVKEHAKNRL